VRVLLTGWFGFLHGETTAGDQLSRDAVAGWLTAAGIAHDVAVSPGFASPSAGQPEGGVDLDTVDPSAYDVLVFTCGPLRGWQVDGLLARFAGVRVVAVSVSVVDGTPVGAVDVLLPRDGAGAPVPDLALVPQLARVPVVAVVLANPQPEYGAGQLLAPAHAVLAAALDEVGAAAVRVDTRLDMRTDFAARTPEQVESVLARADAVLSTRLHGLVLGLKVGVPVVAVDPVRGGAKVAAQAAALGWPCLGVDASVGEVAAVLRWCLTPAARRRAGQAATDGRAGALAVRERLLAAVTEGLGATAGAGEHDRCASAGHPG